MHTQTNETLLLGKNVATCFAKWSSLRGMDSVPYMRYSLATSDVLSNSCAQVAAFGIKHSFIK